MKKEEEKFIDSSIIEGAVSILSVLQNGSREIKRIYCLPKVKRDEKNTLKVFSLAKKQHIEISSIDEKDFEKLTIGHTNGGIIAEVGERHFSSAEEIFSHKDGFVFMLCGIEDPFNFGCAVRSFYAAGATGFMVSPRNWMSAAGVTMRSSAGATEKMPCAVSENNEETINIAKKAGYKVVCASEKDSAEIFSSDLSKPLFLIVGGEKRGISKDILDNSDLRIRIPYGASFGGSLTASAAAAVCAFEVLRQNKKI